MVKGVEKSKRRAEGFQKWIDELKAKVAKAKEKYLIDCHLEGYKEGKETSVDAAIKEYLTSDEF